MAIPENFKQSLIVAKQLPQFINDDESYITFVRFIEAYYEWLECEYNIYDRTKNLLNYKDIDNTLTEFEEHFYNEFLPYFPSESLTNKKELVKLSKEFYQRKGTEASFKFLFRALYNAECETFHTRKMLFIPSSGKWVISKSIIINTLDDRFLNISNYKIVGETSKSIAKIERSQYSGTKIEIFLSDIEREFKTGEYVRIVDNEYNDIYINNQVLIAKIIGAISSININENNRGLYYNTGDPIIFYGGTNENNNDITEATGIVNDVTVGDISNISILDGGYGYSTFPNTTISLVGGGESVSANVYVSEIDNTAPILISNISFDMIQSYSNVVLSSSYTFPSGSANANTMLSEALSQVSFVTYPIKTISIASSGSKYITTPTADIKSHINYNNTTSFLVKDIGICSPIKIIFPGVNYANGDTLIFTGGSGTGAYANVKLVDANGSIILTEYINDSNNILPLGGIAYDNLNLPSITINSANNKIFTLNTNSSSLSNTNILYFANTNNVKIGMFVYGNNITYDETHEYFKSNTQVIHKTANTVTISKTLNNNNNIGDSYEFDGSAILRVPSILGDSASVAVNIDKIGQILSLKLITTGEDYIESPTISLKIMDIIVYNVNNLSLPTNGQIIYQGYAENPSFSAYVHSIIKLDNEIEDLYRIRIFDYNGNLNNNEELFVDTTTINSKEIQLYIKNTYNKTPFIEGIKIFGDGNAKANCYIENGSVATKGNYLNSDGFPSSYCKLQGEIYNDFTYILSVEKAISSYKNVLYNILHPSGTQAISRNIIKTPSQLNVSKTTFNNMTYNLYDYINSSAYARMILNSLKEFALLTNEDEELLTESYETLLGSNFTEFPEDSKESKFLQNGSNKIYIKQLDNISLSNVVFQNSIIQLITNNNEKICSKILDVTPNVAITLVSQNEEVILTEDNIEIYANTTPIVDTITLQDYIILKYANVMYGYGNSNTMVITNLTGKFDVINNGVYKYENHLNDIIYANDYVEINNSIFSVSDIDYTNNILYLNDNINYGNITHPKLVNVIRNIWSNNITIKLETGQTILV